MRASSKTMPAVSWRAGWTSRSEMNIHSDMSSRGPRMWTCFSIPSCLARCRYAAGEHLPQATRWIELSFSSASASIARSSPLR